jgi:hypothetical protein
MQKELGTTRIVDGWEKVFLLEKKFSFPRGVKVRLKARSWNFYAFN